MNAIRNIVSQVKPFGLLIMLMVGCVFVAGAVASAYTQYDMTKSELLWSETLHVGPNATEVVGHNWSWLVKSGKTFDGRYYEMIPSLATEFNTSINFQEEWLVAGASILSKTHYNVTWFGFQACDVGLWHISANTTKTVQMHVTETKVWTEAKWRWNEFNTAFLAGGLFLVVSFFGYCLLPSSKPKEAPQSA